MKLLYFTLFFVFCLATSALAVININTGDMDELTSLPGIGPVKAEAIIKYREEKGQFQKIEELKNVYGIGEKIIARIKGDITVGEIAPSVTVSAVDKEQQEKTEKTRETGTTTPASTE
jgi:competence protein ComEA